MLNFLTERVSSARVLGILGALVMIALSLEHNIQLEPRIDILLGYDAIQPRDNCSMFSWG